MRVSVPFLRDRMRPPGTCRLVVLVMLLAVPCRAEPAKWWNTSWPYRAVVECPAGPGDVASVTLRLAGRTTADGRDLRLIDADAGSARPFEILHHDPKLASLVRFQVPPDEPRTVHVYFGNLQAPLIETCRLPGVSRGQASRARSEWKKSQEQREKLLEQQSRIQKELAKRRRAAEKARATGNLPPPMLHDLHQSIQELQRQLEALLQIPPELPEPDDPTQWHPRRGLVLRVHRKAQEEHPRGLYDLRKLMERSAVEGAAFRDAISDGFNPFGPSDHYLSVYEGYLRIDEPGMYGFCSASSDGSWVIVNDTVLVEWPGPHGWEGSEHGEKNGRITLRPGVARVRYYHEEGDGRQMAFLGWQTPKATGFTAIPSDRWLPAREAKVAAYEPLDKPMLAIPSIQIPHTYWVRDTTSQQVTMVRLRCYMFKQAAKIARVHWSFGDGLEATGEDVQHAYFRLGRPDVTLTVTDEAGRQDTLVCSPNVYQVDVQAPGVGFGQAEQYIAVATPYDPDRMPREDLEPFADFWLHLEQWPPLVRAVESFLRRFPNDPAIPRLTAGAAQGYLQPSAYNPQRADQLIQQALAGINDPRERVGLALLRARVLAWDLQDYPQADALYREIQQLQRSPQGKDFQDEIRRCLIGRGDVKMLAGDHEQAAQLYRQAQEAARTAKQPEEVAKTGSYPYSVEDLLARGEFDWALRTIDEWEDQFPMQKLEGYSFFLRGKVLFVQRPGPQALRYLELTERVTPRAVHVPEAVWLRANCLMAMGQHDKALDEFRRIRIDFTHSEFFTLTEGKIQQCQAALGRGDTHAQGK